MDGASACFESVHGCSYCSLIGNAAEEDGGAAVGIAGEVDAAGSSKHRN
jgi:hypothetical protein